MPQHTRHQRSESLSHSETRLTKRCVWVHPAVLRCSGVVNGVERLDHFPVRKSRPKSGRNSAPTKSTPIVGVRVGWPRFVTVFWSRIRDRKPVTAVGSRHSCTFDAVEHVATLTHHEPVVEGKHTNMESQRDTLEGVLQSHIDNLVWCVPSANVCCS